MIKNQSICGTLHSSSLVSTKRICNSSDLLKTPCLCITQILLVKFEFNAFLKIIVL